MKITLVGYLISEKFDNMFLVKSEGIFYYRMIGFKFDGVAVEVIPGKNQGHLLSAECERVLSYSPKKGWTRIGKKSVESGGYGSEYILAYYATYNERDHIKVTSEDTDWIKYYPEMHNKYREMVADHVAGVFSIAMADTMCRKFDAEYGTINEGYV